MKGKSTKVLIDHLKSLPTGLKKFYALMLKEFEELEQDDIQDGIRILQFCLYSQRAIELAELNHAMAIPAGLRDPNWHPDATTWREEISVGIRNRIINCLRNFLEVKPKYINYGMFRIWLWLDCVH
jgi:hypothetical protein